ncbi:MAG: hypothetical protein AAGA57_07470, partial [Planctomycetota bacterium]
TIARPGQPTMSFEVDRGRWLRADSSASEDRAHDDLDPARLTELVLALTAGRRTPSGQRVGPLPEEDVGDEAARVILTTTDAQEWGLSLRPLRRGAVTHAGAWAVLPDDEAWAFPLQPADADALLHPNAVLRSAREPLAGAAPIERVVIRRPGRAAVVAVESPEPGGASPKLTAGVFDELRRALVAVQAQRRLSQSDALAEDWDALPSLVSVRLADSADAEPRQIVVRYDPQTRVARVQRHGQGPGDAFVAPPAWVSVFESADYDPLAAPVALARIERVTLSHAGQDLTLTRGPTTRGPGRWAWSRGAATLTPASAARLADVLAGLRVDGYVEPLAQEVDEAKWLRIAIHTTRGDAIELFVSSAKVDPRRVRAHGWRLDGVAPQRLIDALAPVEQALAKPDASH